MRPCLAGSSLVATASTTAARTAGGGRQPADERRVFKDPQKPEIPFKHFLGKDMGVYARKASRFRRFSLYRHPHNTLQRDRLKSPTSIKHPHLLVFGMVKAPEEFLFQLPNLNFDSDLCCSTLKRTVQQSVLRSSLLAVCIRDVFFFRLQ